MAADEPPYLTIGTDVSAKYKGAFCEAKIKKVNRIVKCKVTFKNNLGSFVLIDDQIKGTLRNGADIEAKHPEKNQFLEAVINKLQDYSQYTVVFDDGDETTLRRTSLCLKSGRHFAESPTLDQFPLTNPEHFGTPVIGSGKFKRKRRSTLNSSLDYESSDEDSLPRKLKAIRGKERDPDIGKVVSVDYGDRRKKENWYPGLIVPLPPQSNIKILKEEHLIRSFKDGKYYQVPKRDIRDFTKETGQKVENNALRIAIEKAVLYLEKEELPPHWDKVLFSGLEYDESNESESDSSDDEPSEEKDRFVAQLYKFMDERGTPINKAPTVSNRDLNLYKLFKIMHKLGGYNKVTNKNKWKTVYSKMGLPHSANGPNQVKFAYKRYLQSFEDFYRKLGCTMVNNSRSTRGRHRSDRNIIITRTRDRDTASPKSKIIKETKEKAVTEKKNEDKNKTDKKENKSEEVSKIDEKLKILEKKKVEEEKPKKEERRRLTKKEEEAKPEKARTREDARKEKNDSPEKKGTRSSLKIESDKKEKEEAKEKKTIKEKKEEKLLKEDKTKSKKEEVLIKDRKTVREKKLEEKTKEKRENPIREKRDASKEKKEPLLKSKKEENKIISSEEKSPKRKLERAVKKETSKLKCEEIENKESEKKEAKPSELKEEQFLKKPKPKEEPPPAEEEKIIDIEDITLDEDKKMKLRNESEDESNKVKRKFLKSDDDKEPGFSDSDESLTNDSEKPSSNKDLKKEIEVGDRVKVKYGRGRNQKVYEAKVLKIETDGLEKRYYVHYAGWNMRYDEWVRKNYIVAVINGNKKFETTSKNTVPPSSMKKQERGRLPGLKSTRKNSTSSTNSNVSRSTRSDKREDSDTKISKKYDTSAADTSQESGSEREDDDEGNDADVDDTSTLQTDSCFKEELFSDDEEKDKSEDAKHNIDEIEKAMSSEDICGTEIASTVKSFEDVEANIGINSEDQKDKLNITAISENKAITELPSISDKVLVEEKEVKQEITQMEQSLIPNPSYSELEMKSSPIESPILKTISSIPPSDNNTESNSKHSVLNFSGLIKPESSKVQYSSHILFKSSLLQPSPAINVHKTSDITEVKSIASNYEAVSKSKTSNLKESNVAEDKDILSLKSGSCSEKTSAFQEDDNSDSKQTETNNETVVQNDAAGSSCPVVFNEQNKDEKADLNNLTEEKVILTNDSMQNIFIPSFSPQNVDPPNNKQKIENRLQSETVDVSKMIPGILERLKNDVVTEFDSPSPQQNELTFDFLRENSGKSMSRSDSSSSLRICESDTNDSNIESKDHNFKPSFIPVIESCHKNDTSKSSTLSSAAEINASVKDLNTCDNERINEAEYVIKTAETRFIETDKSTNDSSPNNSFQTIDITPLVEKTLNLESELKESETLPAETESLKISEVTASSSQSVDNEDNKGASCDALAHLESPVISFSTCSEPNLESENVSCKNELFNTSEAIAQIICDNSLKEASDSNSTNVPEEMYNSQKLESSVKCSPLQYNDKFDLDAISKLKEMAFPMKKEGKKKKFSKKLGKKFLCSEVLDKEYKDLKIMKNKTKKKMRFDSFSVDKARNLDMKSKSKKLKKNKNKKRLKREDSCEIYSKIIEDDEIKDFEKLKRKEKKKIDKKFFKCSLQNDESTDSKIEALKKKKGKKNREKLSVEKKDFYEKKTKKKRKLHLDNNQDTDSEKESLPKVEKKRKKKKPKIKDCSSSDDEAEKFFKEETMDLPSTSDTKQDSKSDDPDMSFLLCEEKVPASPVDINNLVNDVSSSSSMEEESSELLNVTNTSTVMDNTPPTTPSSTESLLSSSPTHDRESFTFLEGTQSGRESGDGESNLFHCGSNRVISRESEEYYAATTLAFAVCRSVSDKSPVGDFTKQEKTDAVDSQPSKRKKKSTKFRRISESTKSPKHKSSYLRMSKVENCYEDSSGTSLATLSSSPPYGLLNFSRSLPASLSNASNDAFYMPLFEKDPEKRIALLQKKMSELRKEYMSLRAEVIAIDHKRRKARKKVKESVGSTANLSIHSEDGQSCS